MQKYIIGSIFFIAGLLSWGFLSLINDFPPNFSNNTIVTNTDKALNCEKCNILIISLTNTRKDHLGIYGYGRDTSPNIDKFFKNSLIFNNAFTHASWTLPSAVSFFTSLYPFSHGVTQRNYGYAIPKNITTFTEQLKNAGYTTAAFTGDGEYNKKFGINKGFDVYVDKNNYEEFGVESDLKLNKLYNPIVSVLPSASKWLKENRKKKFFLFIQGFDTHCPFTPVPPFDKKFDPGYTGNIDFSKCLWTFNRVKPIFKNGKKLWPVRTSFGSNGPKNVLLSGRDVKKLISLYDGEIAQVDEKFAQFFNILDNLNLQKDTIIIFMSEHGDLFGENGRFMRGGPLRGTFYDPVINFPLIIKHPKIKKPVIINDLVQMIDLFPTLISMINVTDVQKEIRQGKKLNFSVFGDKKINKYVYAGSDYIGNSTFFNGVSSIESIRGDKWKLIKETITQKNKTQEYYELYDIKNDPKESKNLYDVNIKIVKALKDKLESWKAGLQKYNKVNEYKRRYIIE